MKRLLLLTMLASVASASAAHPKKRQHYARPAAAPPSPAADCKFSTVVIDAGHGGHDRGGIPGQRACEKDLALDVARRLRDILQQDGIKTVMTRPDDTFIPLPERTAIANAQRDALFMSIHFNSAIRRGADGVETYYYNPGAGRIAARIHEELMRVEPGENRGVKRRAYYVLRKTRGPAVLAECGFLTNPAEAALCQKAAHRQEMAQAIAKAIEATRQKPATL